MGPAWGQGQIHSWRPTGTVVGARGRQVRQCTARVACAYLRARAWSRWGPARRLSDLPNAGSGWSLDEAPLSIRTLCTHAADVFSSDIDSTSALRGGERPAESDAPLREVLVLAEIAAQAPMHISLHMFDEMDDATTNPSALGGGQVPRLALPGAAAITAIAISQPAGCTVQPLGSVWTPGGGVHPSESGNSRCRGHAALAR